MFYFLYGNSPMIEFETEKITDEILEKYPNIILGTRERPYFL